MLASPIWNLVLAAGAGRRLASVTKGVPKQFWRRDDGRSLLDDTLQRMSAVAAPDRTVTIVDRSHHPYVAAVARTSRMGQVIYQPEDRGTAAGVLLGLLHILAVAPDAVVAMTPSDHGVARQDIFHAGIELAARHVRSGAIRIAVFGVDPDAAHGDYGWILPRRDRARPELARVAGFVEKPPAADAERLLTAGAVWNTMVLVANGRALLGQFRRHLPDLTRALEHAVKLDGTGRSGLIATYRQLAHYDFSHHLLTAARPLSLVIWPEAMGWSDLGTPDRLRQWQTRQMRQLSATSAA